MRNRLSSVKKNTSLIAEYLYDGDGGRVQKTSYVTTPAVVTKYIGEMYEETDNVGTMFVFLGSQRVAAIDTNSGTPLYYHMDYLGSTNVMSDNNGNVAELIEYDPYGKIQRHDNYGGNTRLAKQQFTGKKLDDETGLIYFGARYYDPLLGRFITADTIVQNPSDPQTLNRYSYCGNNPINRIDPDGHSWKKIWKKISGFVATAAGVALGFINPYLGMLAYSLIAASGQGGNFGANFGFNLASGLIGMGVGGAVGNLWSGQFMSGLATAAAGGAAASASMAAFTGGDVGMAALAGFTGGAIGFAGGRVWQLGADAIAGGVASVIQGGDFGDGAASGAFTNMAGTLGGIMAPMEKLGNQNLEAGDAVFFKAHNPGAALIAFAEGGIFTHAGTMVNKSEMVEVGLDWKGAQKTNIFTGKDKYAGRSAYVSRQYRGNQSVISNALNLIGSVPGYGVFSGRKICSTATATSYNAAQRGWYGFDPSTQANMMGYTQFYPMRTYGK
ncbi:MAG: RHS repeat-associated core domain-containing protein [Candidatus Omnitrophica bacterium]|nr:RHS repeat-associated core domain-containing protein [Candidatus Omnitrophota bacterium]